MEDHEQHKQIKKDRRTIMEDGPFVPVEASIGLSSFLDAIHDRPFHHKLMNCNSLLQRLPKCTLMCKPPFDNVYLIGSFSEGPLLWSGCTKADIDNLVVINNCATYQYADTATYATSDQNWEFLMETCTRDSAYVRLKVVKEGADTFIPIRDFLSLNEPSNNYLTNNVKFSLLLNKESEYSRILKEVFVSLNMFIKLGNIFSLNGPTLSRIHCNNLFSLGLEKEDFVVAVKCPDWPSVATEWVKRSRVNGWPSEAFISQQVQRGCYVVPVGCKLCDESLLDWRLSFTRVEQALISAFNPTQYHCYILLKHLKANYIDSTGEKITSYIIKTTVFWTIEETPSYIWHPHHLQTLHAALNKLINFIQKDFCPNYFIRNSNLLLLRHNAEEKYDILKRCLNVQHNILESLYRTSPFQETFQSGFIERCEFETYTYDQDISKNIFTTAVHGLFFKLMLQSLSLQQTNRSCIQYCNETIKKIREDSMCQANAALCKSSHIENVLQDHMKKFIWSDCYLRCKTNKCRYICQRSLLYGFRGVNHLSGVVILCHLDAAAENYSRCHEKLKSVISAQRKQPYLRTPSFLHNVELGSIVNDILKMKGFSELSSIWDIIFKKSEVNLVPAPLQLEIYSNANQTRQFSSSAVIGSVVVDPLVYACFLSFWCCMKLDRNIEKLKARGDLKWAYNEQICRL